jgi:CCR4-NOT transcription complex subunit 1
LKNLIVTLGRNMTSQQQEAIDVTVAVIANDNVELACAFIQKKGIEKAIQETDKRLRTEFEARQVVLRIHSAALPNLVLQC